MNERQQLIRATIRGNLSHWQQEATLLLYDAYGLGRAIVYANAVMIEREEL